MHLFRRGASAEHFLLHKQDKLFREKGKRKSWPREKRWCMKSEWENSHSRSNISMTNMSQHAVWRRGKKVAFHEGSFSASSSGLAWCSRENLSIRSLSLQRALSSAAAKFKIKNMTAGEKEKKKEKKKSRIHFNAFPKKKIVLEIFTWAFSRPGGKRSICSAGENNLSNDCPRFLTG